MRRFISRRIGAAALIGALCAATSAPSITLQAQGTTAGVEQYAPLLLKLPAAARSLALGGAQVAMRDADAVFGNPALVGTTTALAFGGERYSSGATLGQFVSSSTIGPLGIGVGAQLLSAGRANGAFPVGSSVLLASPNSTPRPGTSSAVATLAASFTWKQMRWGVGVKYVEERTTLSRASGAVFDVGASRSINIANSTIGVAVQNIGARMRVDGVTAELPTQLALGISSGSRGLGKWFDLNGSTQLDVRRDGELFPRGGVELSYVPIEGVAFTGRVGGRRPQLAAERAVTAGGGFTLDRLTIDYAWEPLTVGSGHRVTLRLR